VLAYLLAWGILLLPLVNMGSQALLSRAFGESKSRGIDLAQRLWTLRVLLMPAVFCLLVAIAMVNEPDPEIRPLFLLVGFALAGRGFAVWSNHVLVADRRARQVLLLEAIFRLGELAAATVALQLGISIAGLLALHAIGWWLQALVSTAWVSRTVVQPAWRWRHLRAVSLLRQSVTVMVCGLALAVLLQGPLTLARHILGNSEILGQFALVMQVLQLLVALPASIGIGALPFLAGAGLHVTRRRYLRRLVPISIAVVLLMAAASAVMAEPLLSVVFGTEYGAVAPLLTMGLLVLVLPLTPAVLLSQAALASPGPDTMRNTALAALGGTLAGTVATAALCLQQPEPGSLLGGAGVGALSWLLLLAGLHRRLNRIPS
jgi:O-antigen/teichoic acid export membrane protein